MESRGYTVKREGRHYSVRKDGDEYYRLTIRDGRWLWCDRYGNRGGDSIDLVREIEPGTGYADAVYRLLGSPRVATASTPSPSLARTPPVLPPERPIDRERGRAYLRARGISDETIAAAEQAGMVRYADGGVLFVGYDRVGTAQSATRRAITTSDPVQKRDLRGSDKSYPPILRGGAEVWVVEGGVDALALWDLMRRAGKALPTVLVTGGAHVVSWVQRYARMLRDAVRVVIAHDREADQERQARADAGHARQRQELERIGARVVDWWPPEGVKDIAELNAAHAAEHAAEQEQEEREHE